MFHQESGRWDIRFLLLSGFWQKEPRKQAQIRQLQLIRSSRKRLKIVGRQGSEHLTVRGNPKAHHDINWSEVTMWHRVDLRCLWEMLTIFALKMLKHIYPKWNNETSRKFGSIVPFLFFLGIPFLSCPTPPSLSFLSPGGSELYGAKNNHEFLIFWSPSAKPWDYKCALHLARPQVKCSITF